MMKNEIVAIFMLMATLAPGAAIANTSEPAAAVQDSGAAELDDDETVLHQLLELSHEAKVSLSEAIATAEKLHDGSRTAQIGFEKPGSPEYRVRTVRGSIIWENTIDARSGQIVGEERSFPLAELGSDDRRDIDALKHVRPDLTEAVRFAEKEVGGKAVGATLIDEDGAPNFAVVVVCDEHLKQVMLEARRLDHSSTASHRTSERASQSR
jgi:uncharacterized membrane protein YkoI